MKLAAAGALVLLIGAAVGIQVVLFALLGVTETRGWLLAGEVLVGALSAVVLTAVASRWRPRWMTVLGFVLALLGLGPALVAPSLSRPSRSREPRSSSRATSQSAGSLTSCARVRDRSPK